MAGFDIGLIIAITSALASALGWHRSIARTQYARERQYEHIFRNLEIQAQAHSEIFKELDAVADRLSRLEILLLKNVHGSSV